MGRVEQIEGKIGRGVDGGLAVGLSEVSRALGKEIEGAFGIVDLETGDFRRGNVAQ